ncbi:uncharacterized protein LOC117317647 [Pecten maximus]|uniref:uncharacterized protein LOC117317647 n=1 Tax=Pecten maximus TaxID=6579 RepID=UPI001458A4BC|nr:uncharacterized protein LOC117317647 [Pecten maximus]
MDPRQQWTRPKLSQEWQPDTLFHHVHLYKGDHLPASGARNYRRPQVPEVQKRPVTYHTNKILVGLLVFFIMTTTAAVTVLILRELSRNQAKADGPVKVIVSSEALMSAYPGMFRTTEQETDFTDIKSNLEDLKPVNRFISIDNKCSVSCNTTPIIEGVTRPQPQPPFIMQPHAVRANIMRSNITGVLPSTSRVREKRSSRSYADNSLYHGCCVSNFYHISPVTLKTTEGHSRTLIQLTNTRQFFQIENCSQALGCVGCTCMTDRVLTTAVVLKSDLDQTTETTMDDLEIQNFYFDSCCKCVNVGFKN